MFNKLYNEMCITQHINIIIQKLMTLLAEISGEPETKTIIFVETKRRVDDITRAVCRNGWRAAAIHGNKTQQERDYVLSSFRNGRQSILGKCLVSHNFTAFENYDNNFYYFFPLNLIVATDVAARGLGKIFCGEYVG